MLQVEEFQGQLQRDKAEARIIHPAATLWGDSSDAHHFREDFMEYFFKWVLPDAALLTERLGHQIPESYKSLSAEAHIEVFRKLLNKDYSSENLQYLDDYN